MNADDPYIVIGKIGSTYGIKGWIKVASFTDPLEGILEYATWHLEETNGWKPMKIAAGRAHGKGIVVKFAAYNTPEEVKKLTGKRIAIMRSQLATLAHDEYYWTDLEGLTVINKDGETLGKVIYLIETGSNDVLVVKGTKEHAIPYLPGEVIISVDLAKKEMHVAWDVI